MTSASPVLNVNRRVRIPFDEFQFTYARSSGPGGQNVNKVNSKAILRWNVHKTPSLPDDVRARFLQLFGRRITVGGDLLMQSQRYRDQARNVADCLDKLRGLLAQAAHRPTVRKATMPSRGVIEGRLRYKKRQASKKRRRSSRDWDEHA